MNWKQIIYLYLHCNIIDRLEVIMQSNREFFEFTSYKFNIGDFSISSEYINNGYFAIYKIKKRTYHLVNDKKLEMYLGECVDISILLHPNSDIFPEKIRLFSEKTLMSLVESYKYLLDCIETNHLDGNDSLNNTLIKFK